MRARAVVLAVAIVLAPLGAQAADLVVWWEKGFYPQEDGRSGRSSPPSSRRPASRSSSSSPHRTRSWQAEAALAAGRPPDFLFGTLSIWVASVGLRGPARRPRRRPRPVLDLFDADAIERPPARRQDGPTRPLRAADGPIFQPRPCLEQPRWSGPDSPSPTFPRVGGVLVLLVRPGAAGRAQGPRPRRHLGRWAANVRRRLATPTTSSCSSSSRTARPGSTRDRRPQLDDPAVRARIIRALTAYTAVWRKGCTPPDSTSWTNIDNNKAFLAQTVVMTVNTTLSIPGALRTSRPDDYYKNAATIEWPNGADGQPLVIDGDIRRPWFSRPAGIPRSPSDFVRFLAEEGWLAHWLDFAGDQFTPPMRKLVEQPFWLDPSDPHRMRAAIQILTRQHLMNMIVRDHEWQSARLRENVWGKAVHRVAAEGISPEQAVDEAILRIKQILSE